jgi:membrane protease YdiL (CAAX protease family)
MASQQRIPWRWWWISYSSGTRRSTVVGKAFSTCTAIAMIVAVWLSLIALLSMIRPTLALAPTVRRIPVCSIRHGRCDTALPVATLPLSLTSQQQRRRRWSFQHCPSGPPRHRHTCQRPHRIGSLLATAAADSNAPSPEKNGRIPSFFRALGNTSWVVQFVLQCIVLMGLYLLHMTVLSQHVAIVFGVLPIGYDTLLGALIALWYGAWYRPLRRHARISYPWSLPQAPPRQSQLPIANATAHGTIAAIATTASTTSIWKQIQTWSQSTNWQWIRFRTSSLLTMVALVYTYFRTGQFSLFWEDLLFAMSAAGWPLTVPLSRSCQVLLGHLTWVAAGSALLWALPRPPPFFASLPLQTEATTNDAAPTNNRYHWFSLSLSSPHWVWWSIGGYFVSCCFFNVADAISHLVLPAQVLEAATESVVTQLVQPEYNDIWASIVGYLAPCVSAPVWEEVLYRGFLLSALTAGTGSWHAASVLQAIIFSAHHLSVTAALPLAVLGWTWAYLYTQSRNLWTVIVVHALWNSRVFIGSWFGL